MSLKKTDQARRKRVKDADQKKTNGEEDARSLRPTKKTFGLPLTAGDPWLGSGTFTWRHRAFGYIASGDRASGSAAGATSWPKPLVK
jgi:hypothetical protein